ncbi:hypothetical protein BASA50_009565 [Batrachochytrium salamandrivorans]|uniref:Uncharacterized protein n=1 Tax=Batrachochytrium salamandrivorans TaxID=1357716 RepID=A0ABQ8F1Z4_9FUNG|nr:hypothetical protein BASA62_007904 [Batrachochytrium salamandrivorans]KAH6583345.1 hypothetical protein BASA61_008055 [Batrachochytrium salamandrivorans]KAH6590152.1 hypothetical protein BASA50_009565 [Batrachochytrium salamandrivorans]KAH9257392.1 hypothetical protein BASA81_004550 [Batrachochytrium salamandrivorans]KAH9266455.1 hypothetical protein BASA83_010573 [Batrachochytrium salamandrivorans]
MKSSTDLNSSAGLNSNTEMSTDDLTVIEARAEASVGLVRNMVDSWLPASYKDQVQSKTTGPLLYNNSGVSKKAIMKSKLHKSILGRGRNASTDLLDKNQLLSKADTQVSVTPSPTGISKLSGCSDATRASKPRPFDPLSMYLGKGKKKRTKT